MILRNPTENDIKVKIFGTEYLMEAGKEMRLKDDVAIFWRKNLHAFLEVVNEKDTKEEVSHKPRDKGEDESVEEVIEKPKKK